MLSMNPLLQKFITPRHEYLAVDRNLIVLEASSGANRFAYDPDDLRVGEDARIPFPELLGVEDTLLDILEGRQMIYELKGIARSNQKDVSLRAPAFLPPEFASDRTAFASPSATGTKSIVSASSPSLYFDLYISDYFNEGVFEKRLIVFFEETTEQMVLQQRLVQQVNETSLLLSSLAASNAYIDRIISSMADALIVTSASGIIKTVNQSTQDLLGYNQHELIDKPVLKLIKDEKFLQKVNDLSSSMPGELLKDIEVICQTKAGEEIFIAFSCSAVQTEVEGIKNFIYIGRDITERKRAEAEMIRTLERERELRELKSGFISMTSHEFRNPLSSILSSTELLEHYTHTGLEDKHLKHYDRIKAAVQRMTELLDDVLLLGKAESGKLEFNPKPLELQEFGRNLVEEIKLGSGKNHKVNFVYSGQNTTACIDEKLLQHILNNLLTNAIKYSPQGSTICFGCYCQDEEVVFEIEDQGIGIPKEDQQRLFESFHRAKNVGTIPGTGLGLAIVKKSVELHGGRIAVKSEVGVGTIFKVTLPLR
ncbi:MAG: PAS domain-containing sensor histidine kinase [Coleofasciculus sp. S288]|nr:PAS domain-containing sensor histidine kinase [Coleofasciculus sp. S288]